jgi:cytochrome c1
MRIFAVSLLLLGVLPLSSPARAAEVQLSLSRLKAHLQPVTLTVDDPVYRTKKTYEGFWLQDVLKLEGLLEKPADELGLKCADGYTPALPWGEIRERRGLIAYREVGQPGGWQKLKQGKKTITPAPFYLVWAEKDPSLPWPYQLVALQTVSFAEKYGELVPAGTAPSAAARHGVELFRKQCLKCHSLNLRGGELGPELNYPRNITEYRDEQTLREFIRNPAAFRARSAMPGFPQLSDAEVGQILEYLRWMRDRKQPLHP